MKSIKKIHFLSLLAYLSLFIGLCLISMPIVLPYITAGLQHYNETLSSKLFTASFKKPTKAFANAITKSCDTFTLPKSSSQILPQYLPLLITHAEVIGWIRIDDTLINYPILQHTDNDYYLNHDYAHYISNSGSIYIDYRNDINLNDKNTLVYGHNMNNGAMFHDLIYFKEQDFFTSHPYIYVSNLYEQFTYEVFAVYVVDADVETIAVDYENDNTFLDYLQNCQSRATFARVLPFTATDQIITLVTCSYESNNARTIVQAKRIS